MNKIFQNPKTIDQMRTGPLGPFLDEYRNQLLADGYSRHSARRMLRIISLFSHWLEARQIDARQIEPHLIGDYLRHRRRNGYRPYAGGASALNRMLKLLEDAGAISTSNLHTAESPSERLLKDYGLFLIKERCLALDTRISYRAFTRKFLSESLGEDLAKLPRLKATDVIGYVQRHAKGRKPKCAQLMTTALRSFLRYLYYRGDLPVDLAGCVPAVASWSLATVPRALPADHVRRVLLACDRKSAVGRRDYAILLLLARLGLRSGEVTKLKLDDIEWKNGLINIYGKGGRADRLPLPTDVGQAIAAYLQKVAPESLATDMYLSALALPLLASRISSLWGRWSNERRTVQGSFQKGTGHINFAMRLPVTCCDMAVR